MSLENIEYTTQEIVEYFGNNRIKWDDFYKSEQKIFTRVLRRYDKTTRILDVGCAAGGLGYALSERFGITEYTGMDINRPVIEFAEQQQIPVGACFQFVHGDIVNDSHLVGSHQFDIVVSLSCVDWNLCPEKSVKACWAKVKPGGYFIISLRLTPEEGVNDINKSYQPIIFSYAKASGNEEKANYVVYNTLGALNMVNSLNPNSIEVYGYWGKPSKTAVTQSKKLIFSVFAIQKREMESPSKVKLNLELPVDAFLKLDENFSL